MKAIWKYTLGYPEPKRVSIEVQSGARLMHVALQPTEICLWMLVDTEAPKIRQWLRVVATGEEIPESADYYFGMVQHEGLVWHVLAERE